jgi:hypothetical protein
MNYTFKSLLRTSEDYLKLKLIGIYLIFIFVAGLLLNSILLWIFYEKKELRISLNLFVIAITFNNLVGCLTEIPFVILSNFSCK